MEKFEEDGIRPDSATDIEADTGNSLQVSTPAASLSEVSADDPLAFSGIVVDSQFARWALDTASDFLNLADLPPIQMVDALRGKKEPQIRDSINMANSVLVLLANYGSHTDNADLVAVCEQYALKMNTIIKRLCL